MLGSTPAILYFTTYEMLQVVSCTMNNNVMRLRNTFSIFQEDFRVSSMDKSILQDREWCTYVIVLRKMSLSEWSLWQKAACCTKLWNLSICTLLCVMVEQHSCSVVMLASRICHWKDFSETLGVAQTCIYGVLCSIWVFASLVHRSVWRKETN